MARKGSNGDQQIGQGGIVWTNEKRRLGDLIPWPRNPRQIKKAEARRLVESVDEFGQVETLAIGPGNDIYNGHQRLNVLMAEHGPDLMVDVRVSSRPLSEKEREKLTVLLHRGAAGSWDFDLLANEFDADELIEWGFEAGELGLGVDGGSGDDAEPQIDRAEELRREWGVEAGQLWRLPSRTPGQEHRLICGDCTDAAVVERVMGGERAAIALLDPPYGMRLDADFSGMVNSLKFAQGKGVKNGRAYSNVIGDHEDYDARPLLAIVDDVKEQIWFGANYYSSTLPDTEHGGSWLVWDKRLDESADKMFGSCFELMWSRQPHKQDIIRHKWAGIFGTENEPVRGRVHPNQKPVALYVDLLTRYGGAVVIDPYAGSGNSIIAAENLSRQCRACEISAPYVSVALQRYLDTFGIRGELAD